MECHKIIYLLNHTNDQPSKFNAKNWIKVNVDERGTYKTSSQFKFETTMFKSSLCEYNDVHILVKRTISITGTGADPALRNADKINKQVTFKNCVSFTD